MLILKGMVVVWFGGIYEKYKDVGIWIVRWLDNSWIEFVEVVNGI